MGMDVMIRIEEPCRKAKNQILSGKSYGDLTDSELERRKFREIERQTIQNLEEWSAC